METDLQALFEDGGAALLAAAGMETWEDALVEADVPDDYGVIESLVEIRDHWERFGESELAASLTHTMVDHLATQNGPHSPGTLAQMARLGRLLARVGRAEEGQILVERTWENICQVVRPGDRDRAEVAAVYGALRVAQGRASEAIFPLREAVRVLHDTPLAGDAAFRLGQAQIEFGAIEEGLRLVQQSVRVARDASVPGPDLVERLGVLAQLVTDRLSPKDAEGVHREALNAAQLVHGQTSPEAADAQVRLAALLMQISGRGEEALGLFDSAVALLFGSVGASDPRTRNAAAILVERLIDTSKVVQQRRQRKLARDLLQRAEDIALSVFGPDDSRILRVRELISRV